MREEDAAARAMKVPDDKTITLTFASHQVKDRAQRWAVNVTLPGGAGPDAVLRVHAEDGLGAPVAEGVFEFAGQSVALAGGEGAIRYADFVAGKHERAIWMRRPGMEPVPGSLTFA